jgi:hypothetical protein
LAIFFKVSAIISFFQILHLKKKSNFLGDGHHSAQKEKKKFADNIPITD